MSAGIGVPRIFDRRRVRQRRDRSAALAEPVSFLHEEVATRWPSGSSKYADDTSGSSMSARARARWPAPCRRTLSARWSPAICPTAGSPGRARRARVVADEELLPFAPASFDAVVARMSLHWVNDLPGALAQLVALLRPDGLFVGAFPGGETLRELRAALLEAELELRGGSSPRVSPVVDLRDAAALLQRVGLALPVADLDRITVSYADPWRLLSDLRAMGESSALVAHGGPLRRDVLTRALDLYRREHAGGDGRVSATFDIVFATGWRPDASQPVARPRGSAKVRLSDVLGRRTRDDSGQ